MMQKNIIGVLIAKYHCAAKKCRLSLGGGKTAFVRNQNAVVLGYTCVEGVGDFFVFPTKRRMNTSSAAAAATRPAMTEMV